MGRTVRRRHAGRRDLLNLIATPIEGVYVIETESHEDDRGSFARLYDSEVLARAGLMTEFPQHSIAKNRRAGTIRGLHYQAAPHEETKIVRCLRGSLYDVAVDLRPRSASFGAWTAVELSEENMRALYIPADCAHGYQTLVDGTEAHYMISASYLAEAARGIIYDDASLAIAWPLDVTGISARDRGLPRLRDLF